MRFVVLFSLALCCGLLWVEPSEARLFHRLRARLAARRSVAAFYAAPSCAACGSAAPAASSPSQSCPS